MNEQQEELLARYREMWAELNAVNSLRAELDERAREIHARQRQIANKVASLGGAAPAHTVEVDLSAEADLSLEGPTMTNPRAFTDALDAATAEHTRTLRQGPDARAVADAKFHAAVTGALAAVRENGLQVITCRNAAAALLDPGNADG